MATGTQAEVVRSTVNYVRNRPAADTPLTFVTEDDARSTMVTLPGEAVEITSARGLATHVDREGFELVRHVSAVEDFDRIGSDPATDQRYVEEIEALVTRVVGASKVVVLGGGKKRYGEAAVDKLAPLANAKPARYPHADNTDRSATGLAELVAGAFGVDLGSYRRWAMYNVWRAVSSPPQDIPLAVCDARTVAAADEVTVTAVTEEAGVGEIVHDTTAYAHNPAHRWCYFPDMTRDEVLVFKAHDTDPARAGRVPHTAFSDPSCPAGVPTRASVEMRALALFG